MKDISFLKKFFLIVVVMFIGGCENTKTNKTDITDNLCIIHGDINGAVITSGNHKLVIYGDPENTVSEADLILFTHARRDVVWAGRDLVNKGAKAIVPANETGYFSNPDSVWAGLAKAQFHDYRQKQSHVPVKPIPIFRSVVGGDTILWKDIPIKVIDSKGYTEGAVSYLIHIDDIDVAFVGDLVYGDGKIMDIYSLQDEVPELDIWGYHGFATRIADLIRSLERIAELKPDIIIPVRGPIINNPTQVIPKLIHRLRLTYKNFLSINSYKWYRSGGWGKVKDVNAKLAERVLPFDMPVEYMSLAETGENPSWLVHHVNSKLIVSEDGKGFLVDCGMKKAYDDFINLKDNFSCSAIEGVFISHYHDDHTEYINKIREKYNCSAYITKELEDILNHPQSYNLPAMTTESIKDLTVVPEGTSINWKEFTFTFYYFPGQTIYHDAILVKNNKSGEKIFLTGDSFSPTGIDDYCLQNRNLLGNNLGYLYCIDILKNLSNDCWLVNNHIEPTFRFSKEQLSFMNDNLVERQTLLQDLFPWDNINYGIDEQWARIYPYSQEIIDRKSLTEFNVIISNHSERQLDFTIHPNTGDMICSPETLVIQISAGEEGKATFKLNIPDDLSRGNKIITADISFDKWNLHEWCESIIKLQK